MSDKTPDILIAALRQYQHNDCSGFVTGFDYDETVAIVKSLEAQRDELLAALKTARRTARLMHTTDQHETVCIEPQHWRAIMDLIAKYEAKS